MIDRSLLGRGWKPYRGCCLLGLIEPRLVDRVGYEVDFEGACRIVAREAVSSLPGEASTDWDDVRQDKEFDAKIVSTHPKLWRYWDDRGNIRKHLEDVLGEALGGGEVGGLLRHANVSSILEVLDHAVVRTMALDRLRARIRDGEERKIWFTKPPETMMLPDAHEIWRGPWKVLGWRRAYTGVYYPSSGDGEGFDPAGLARTKAHTILKITYVGEWAGWGEHVALKEDTYPWNSEEVAMRMMEEPAESGAGTDGN